MDDILKMGANLLESAAPTIASMFGGPLAGQAVMALEGVLGLKPDAGASLDQRKAAALTALTQATPEQLLELKKEDNRHAETLAQLNLKRDEDDQQSQQQAREMQIATKSKAVPAIAALVLVSFFGIAVMGMVGAYQLMTGTVHLTPEQAGLAVAGAGLVGTIIGYFAAQAQTVISYYFGSSHQSAAKTDQMAQSMDSFMQQVAKQASGNVVALKRAAAVLLVIGLGLSATTAAVAAPPENADPALAPWFRSLAQPDTGISCCSLADCRPVTARITPHGYQIEMKDGAWLDVPPGTARRTRPASRWPASLMARSSASCLG